MKTELYKTNIKIQGFIYEGSFQHNLHWLIHIVKTKSVIKLNSIICTRPEELGNEAKLIMLNNKTRVVVTYLGCVYTVAFLL